MKKFYSVIAAAALGSMISASAFTQLDRPVKRVGVNLRNIEVNDLKETPKHTRALSGVDSRAGEQIDITEFTQAVYYDYFFNWEGNTFRDIRSSCDTKIVYNGDGTYTVNGFAGYDAFNPTLYVTNDGGLAMKAGEVLYKTNAYTFILASIDDNGSGFTEGDIPFEIYSNGIATAWIGVYAINSTTGAGAGWQALLVDYVALQPNATITYKRTMNGATEDINNRVYVEFLQADPNADQESDASWDRLNVSNVTPFNSGTEVNLLMLTDDMLLTIQAIAMESQPMDELGNETGDFYMSICYTQDGNLVFDPYYVVCNVESEYDITWPHENEEFAPEAPEGWGIFSLSGYGFGLFTEAKLTLDHEGTEGISDIITDNAVNAPAAYYNFQGIQIANPVAGQAYIVKQGNQVSKQIMK